MIDGGLARWPDEVIRALSRFKQGHLVSDPPFFYAAVPQYAIWALTRSVEQPGEDAVVLELDPEGASPPYGLITTQTCDLNEQLARPRQPWLQLVPVYRWDSLEESKKRQVEKHEVGHLLHLAGPNLTPGFWVADLRIEVPVEKSWLVGREPTEAFADEKGYLRLAERLAGRRARPALANSISDQIVRPLRRELDKLSATRRRNLLEPVEELRLAVYPSRLEPTSAQLLIITYDDPPPQHIASWFDEWWDHVQSGAAAAGVSLLGSHVTTMERLSAREYSISVSLDFRYLSPEAF